MKIEFGLKENDIFKINKIFQKYHEIKEVIIYGSRALGNYRPGSDIDLTLIGNGLNLNLINKLATDIDDLLLPYLFDISIYQHIKNEDLLLHIDRNGKVFYHSQTATAIKKE
ncbi:MAG: nucleotidyltransferase domain-containing protein [Pelobium sp.]